MSIPNQENIERGSFAGILLRLYWMAAGSVITIIGVVLAFKTSDSSRLSFILLTTALVTNIAARYLDIKFYLVAIVLVLLSIFVINR